MASGVCRAAAAGGHLHILQWARSQSPPCPWNEWACRLAAEHGHVDVLQWLRSETPPCPWNEFVCRLAALRGRLDALQWLRSQTPPCPWNEWVCSGAAIFGDLMCCGGYDHKHRLVHGIDKTVCVLLMEILQWHCSSVLICDVDLSLSKKKGQQTVDPQSLLGQTRFRLLDWPIIERPSKNSLLAVLHTAAPPLSVFDRRIKTNESLAKSFGCVLQTIDAPCTRIVS